MSTDDVAHALDSLRRIIRSYDGVVVAYSGGVDSTLVAAVAHQELAERALAVTARSELYPPSETEDASRQAREMGIRHEVISVAHLELDCFRDNPPDRCYECKRELFRRLREIADRDGLREVADGANADDVRGRRPGLRAAEELGVRSPLREAKIGKEMVRWISRELGLATWNRPAFTCYATRFPYGLAVTAAGIEQVRRAEEVLASLGLETFRVRHHDAIARIEVPPDEIAKLASPEVRARLVRELKRVGYTYVTLDLEGFRSGSMDEVLPEGK